MIQTPTGSPLHARFRAMTWAAGLAAVVPALLILAAAPLGPMAAAATAAVAMPVALLVLSRVHGRLRRLGNEFEASDAAVALLRGVADAAPFALLAKDREFRITYANKIYLDSRGMSASQVLGRRSEELYPDSPLRLDQAWSRVMATGETVTTRMPPAELGGRRVDVRFTHFPMLGADGRLIGAGAIAEDMTREALLAEENGLAAARYRMISEMTPAIVWCVGSDGALQFVSQRWEEFVGPGRPAEGWRSLVHPDDRVAVEAAFQRALAERRPLQTQFRLRHKSGPYRWVAARAIADSAGDAVRYFGSFTDIDELVRTQQEARELQVEAAHLARVAEMGHMVSALAHELNQPLAAAASYLQGAELFLAQDVTQAREGMTLASEQLLRAGDIVRRLRAFLHKQPAQRTDEDVEELVRDAVALGLIGSSARDIQLCCHYSGPCRVQVDRVQIQQVIVNLIRNAIEAMEGSVERRLHVGVAPAGQSAVEIRVKDTGTGLSSEAQARLFSPFSSSKSTGLGIGLAISRTIVEAHGGRIWADPPHSGGATFRVVLPLAAAK